VSEEERWCVSACKSHAPKLTENCVCVRDATGRPVTGWDNLRRMAAAPELEAEIARLRARIAELEAAARPFLNLAGYADSDPLVPHLRQSATFGDCNRLAALLEKPT
jgi:hypothetical protein